MKDNSKLVLIILAIITICVVVYDNFFGNKKNVDENKINIVMNYSNFYTVNSCLSRTIDYISEKESNNLIKVISDNYKTKNNITESNVLSIFDSVDANSSFESRKMYQQVINKNITKYYVYGLIKNNTIMDDNILNNEKGKEVYFIVYLDTLNKIFSVEPYDGKIFLSDLGGEYNEE